MSDPVGKKLSATAGAGRVSEVSSLLRDHPDIDVNWTISDKWTALHAASYNGYVEVVKLLLAHPDIDVNVKEWVDALPSSLVVSGAKCLLFGYC